MEEYSSFFTFLPASSVSWVSDLRHSDCYSDVGLLKIFSWSVGCILSYWQYHLPYRSFSVSWGPICQLLIFKPEPLGLCSGKFPLCQGVLGYFPLILLLDPVYLVLCGGLWSTWSWALYRDINIDQFAVPQLKAKCRICCIFTQWNVIQLLKIRISWNVQAIHGTRKYHP